MGELKIPEDLQRRHSMLRETIMRNERFGSNAVQDGEPKQTTATCRNEMNLIERIASLTAERDELRADVAQLKAPVSDEEMEAQRWMTDDEQFKDAFNAIIAARSEAKNV
jgi:hypothetical protein